MKNQHRPRNIRLMVFLWVFAVSLTALVLILMNLRGPMIAP
jgi:hypothetical protein